MADTIPPIISTTAHDPIDVPTSPEAKDGTSNFVRPVSMDEVVGLDHIKQTLNYDILGAKSLGEPYPHFILSGAGGLGKTTVAGIIAKITGGSIRKYLASDIRKADDLYTIATQVKDHDVIILEEASGLTKIVGLNLLTWCEEYRLYGAEGGVVDAPKVCFIFPTTNAGRLPHPLRTRCRILQLSYYSLAEMEEILLRAAKKYGVDLSTDKEALLLLAQSSRGTPRIGVLHRLDMLRKVMSIDKLPFCKETVLKMFEVNHINEYGLEHNDMIYLGILYDKMSQNNSRPVSRKIMMQATGFSEDVIDNMIEQYHQQIGTISISSQGRSLTALGTEILGRPAITNKPFEKLKERALTLNLDKLRSLLENDEMRRGGMKVLAPQLNLKYPQDNAMLQAALHKCGFIARRRVGIVPLISLTDSTTPTDD